jgi:hypothetical protein
MLIKMQKQKKKEKKQYRLAWPLSKDDMKEKLLEK